MRNRVDGRITCSGYRITILTASSLGIGVPGPSFIGLWAVSGGIVTGVVMLSTRPHDLTAAAHPVFKCSLLLVAFGQTVAGLACVAAIPAKPMDPTVVESNAFTMHLRSVARASVVRVSVVGLRCHSSCHMIGTMESGLLHSELMVPFNILFIKVCDEIAQGMFSNGVLMQIMVALHVQSSVLKDLQCMMNHSAIGNGFACTCCKCLNFQDMMPERFNAIVNVEFLLESLFIGF